MKPKHILFALSFLLTSHVLNAQAPHWIWAKGAAATNFDSMNNVAIDSGGYVYMGGSFTGSTISFGNTVLTNSNSLGLLDIFLVKYDSSGNVIWATSAGNSSSEEEINDIKTDASGNILVTGYFNGNSITFGSITLINSNPGAYNNDIFIVKYDSSGTVIWAHSGGGIFDDVATSVATDANGNVFITGRYNSTDITFDTTTLINAGSTFYDLFLVKYDSSGNLLWAKTFGNIYDDLGYCVVADASGNVYVTGYFSASTIAFDTITLNNFGNDIDVFIAKFDGNGNVLWAESAGNSEGDYGVSLATDASGNVFLAGMFRSNQINFGGIVLLNTSNFNFDDIFLVKYNSSGQVIWARKAGGSNHDYIESISTDANGNLLMVGTFWSNTITFNSTLLSNTNPGGGGSDIFIAKYNAIGNLLWAKGAGGAYSDRGQKVAIDPSGKIYITGLSRSPSITFGATTLINSGGYDIYIAKLDSAMTTGIESYNNTNAFSIYPNPASDLLTVSRQLFAKSEIVTITITDITGKIIYSTTSITPKTKINIKEFSPGFYIVEIKSSEFIVTQKIVKN